MDPRDARARLLLLTLVPIAGGLIAQLYILRKRRLELEEALASQIEEHDDTPNLIETHIGHAELQVLEPKEWVEQAEEVRNEELNSSEWDCDPGVGTPRAGSPISSSSSSSTSNNSFYSFSTDDYNPIAIGSSSQFQCFDSPALPGGSSFSIKSEEGKLSSSRPTAPQNNTFASTTSLVNTSSMKRDFSWQREREEARGKYDQGRVKEAEGTLLGVEDGFEPKSSQHGDGEGVALEDQSECGFEIVGREWRRK